MASPPRRGPVEAFFAPLPDTPRRKGPLADRGAGLFDDNAPRMTHLPGPSADPPRSAWGFSGAQWLAVGKDVLAEISADRVTAVAGGVTFFGLLALFPAITALVSLFGLVADPVLIEQQLDALGEFLPASARDIIIGQVKAITDASGTALSLGGAIGLMVALWTANGGMKALIDALNVAWFQRETRGLIMLNIHTLGMTIGAIFMAMALIFTIAILPALLRWLPLLAETQAWLSAIRWPILFAAILAAISLLYRWGPSRSPRGILWLLPGALLASGGLMASSALFSWYTANFASYNETYGALGAVVVLMMWMWLAAIAILIGAEVNAVAEKHLRALKGESDDRPR
ncbi:MAG: YihY/virulence factor BrkB family protein [Paracoccus sp. (in: a-proteobacteria)]|nr:YihY/virulence factor BrkB family protein [Paracoccus sp. (in: a-proteobacteria)]